MKWTLFDVCFIISILSPFEFSLFATSSDSSSFSSSIVVPIWILFFSSVWGFRMDLLGFAAVFFEEVAPDLKFFVCRLWVFLVAPDFWVLNCVLFFWRGGPLEAGLTEVVFPLDLSGRDVLLLFRVDGGNKLFRPVIGSFLLASFAVAEKLFLAFIGLLTLEFTFVWLWLFKVDLVSSFVLAASFAGWLAFAPFFAGPVTDKLLRPLKRGCDCLTFDIAERLFLPLKVSRTSFASPGLVEIRDFCVPVLAGKDFLPWFTCPTITGNIIHSKNRHNKFISCNKVSHEDTDKAWKITSYFRHTKCCSSIRSCGFVLRQFARSLTGRYKCWGVPHPKG